MISSYGDIMKMIIGTDTSQIKFPFDGIILGAEDIQREFKKL